MKRLFLITISTLYTIIATGQPQCQGPMHLLIIDGDTNYARQRLMDGDTVLYYYPYKKRRLQAHESEVYKFVQYMPACPYDAQAHVAEWLQQHKTLKDIKGEVAVNFLINKDGTLSNFKLVGKSLHPIADKEILRAAKTLPKWSSGIHNGEPVSIFYTLKFKYN